jgi:hypothetical protein
MLLHPFPINWSISMLLHHFPLNWPIIMLLHPFPLNWPITMLLHPFPIIWLISMMLHPFLLNWSITMLLHPFPLNWSITMLLHPFPISRPISLPLHNGRFACDYTIFFSNYFIFHTVTHTSAILAQVPADTLIIVILSCNFTLSFSHFFQCCYSISTIFLCCNTTDLSLPLLYFTLSLSKSASSSLLDFTFSDFQLVNYRTDSISTLVVISSFLIPSFIISAIPHDTNGG